MEHERGSFAIADVRHDCFRCDVCFSVGQRDKDEFMRCEVNGACDFIAAVGACGHTFEVERPRGSWGAFWSRSPVGV